MIFSVPSSELDEKASSACTFTLEREREYGFAVKIILVQ